MPPLSARDGVETPDVRLREVRANLRELQFSSVRVVLIATATLVLVVGMRHVWLCVVLVVGCGGKKKRAPSAEAPARGSGALELLGFGDDPAMPFAITNNGDKVTVFGKDGAVVARTSIPDEAQPSAHIVGHRLLWVDGKTLHVVDLHGSAPKTLVLAEEPKHGIGGEIAVTGGSTSVAFTQPGGIEIVELLSVKRVFHAERATAVRYHSTSWSYVILDEEVRRVDELGVERWATPIQIAGQHAASLHVGTSVLVRSKSAYVSLAFDTGAILGKGPIKTDPNAVNIVLGKRIDGDVREYARTIQKNAMLIVARDGSDKTLWTAPWPAGMGGFDEMMESVEDRLVAFRYQSLVAMFDAITGKALRAWTLAPKAQLVGLRNGCALVLDERALSCTDADGEVDIDNRRWESSRVDRRERRARRRRHSSSPVPDRSRGKDALDDTAPGRDARWRHPSRYTDRQTLGFSTWFAGAERLRNGSSDDRSLDRQVDGAPPAVRVRFTPENRARRARTNETPAFLRVSYKRPSSPRARTRSHHAAEYFGAPMFGIEAARPPTTVRSSVRSIARKLDLLCMGVGRASAMP